MSPGQHSACSICVLVCFDSFLFPSLFFLCSGDGRQESQSQLSKRALRIENGAWPLAAFADVELKYSRKKECIYYWLFPAFAPIPEPEGSSAGSSLVVCTSRSESAETVIHRKAEMAHLIRSITTNQSSECVPPLFCSWTPAPLRLRRMESLPRDVRGDNFVGSTSTV